MKLALRILSALFVMLIAGLSADLAYDMTYDKD